MSRLSFACFVTLALSLPAFAENWPQWRGPKNDGHSTEKGLVTEWSPTKNILWKLPMPGPGSSTPAIWGDRMFFTSMDKDDVVLMCVGTDGKEKWRKPMGSPANYKQMKDEGGNLASGSCSTDGKLVFAFAGSGKLAAFDFDGKEVWALDTLKIQGEDKFNIQFGAHWTPVLHDGKLYVTLFDRKEQNMLALDASTGHVDWKVERKSDSPKGVESPDVYASPFIWQNGSLALLIVHGNDYCTAHSLRDGAEIWRVTELNPKASYNKAWRAVSSPLVTEDLIIVPSCKKGVTVAIDPLKAKGTIDPGSPAEKWRALKNTPDVPSPIRVGDLVYIMGEVGTLYCYDIKTGKVIYEEKITNMRHRANPVCIDGKLYLVGRDGTTVVVKAGREFEKLAENKLPDVFGASPAVSDGRIYLRGWKDLYCIGTK
ncbi:PQQ-binding-like beta-propeller repeat protein [soil metagenome]